MKKIKLQIYPRTIYITTDAEDFKKHIEEDSNFEMDEACAAKYFDNNENFDEGVIIYFSKEKMTEKFNSHFCATIAHEAFHAVNFIFLDLGIEYDRVNDEHAAYLLTFIYEECFKFLCGEFGKIKTKKL